MANQKPQAPQGFMYCGITGKLFHESEHPGLGLRLHADDVAGTDVAPGHYVACLEQVDHFRPKIAARLAAGDDPSAVAFQKHVLANSGLSVDEIAALEARAADQVAAVRHLRAMGMHDAADQMAAKPTALADEIKRRGIDPEPFCQGGWLQ